MDTLADDLLEEARELAEGAPAAEIRALTPRQRVDQFFEEIGFGHINVERPTTGMPKRTQRGR
jgi:N-acetylglutamate synthase-like GNAT family acetyltransferase